MPISGAASGDAQQVAAGSVQLQPDGGVRKLGVPCVVGRA
jgi:hypothetical protein